MLLPTLIISFKKPFYNLYSLFSGMCLLCVWEHMLAAVRDGLQELILSFHFMDPGHDHRAWWQVSFVTC